MAQDTIETRLTHFFLVFLEPTNQPTLLNKTTSRSQVANNGRALSEGEEKNDGFCELAIWLQKASKFVIEAVNQQFEGTLSHL